jgi:type I restriction enzyme M protein
MNKPAARRRKVLFINAIDEVTRERGQSFLDESHIEKIHCAYRAFRDVEGFAKVIHLDEVRANQGNLNIAMYLRSRQASGNGNGGNGSQAVREAARRWQDGAASLRQEVANLFSELQRAGYPAPPPRREIRGKK